MPGRQRTVARNNRRQRQETRRVRVLPGVTVEVSSPALIEKMRTATTDSAGLYRIVNLPPGTYAVTFTLSGFNTSRREGVECLAGVHGDD